MKVWVCQVRREAFVGGESQRCRHSVNWISVGTENATRGCGEMELTGGEPVEWCVVHEAKRFANGVECHVAVAFHNASTAYVLGKRIGPLFIDACQFVSQVRVGE